MSLKIRYHTILKEIIRRRDKCFTDLLDANIGFSLIHLNSMFKYLLKIFSGTTILMEQNVVLTQYGHRSSKKRCKYSEIYITPFLSVIFRQCFTNVLLNRHSLIVGVGWGLLSFNRLLFALS